MGTRQPYRTITITGIVAPLLLMAHPPQVQAQNYKEVSGAIMADSEVKPLRREVIAIVRSGGNLTADDQRTLQRYYVRHVLAGMTLNRTFDDPERYPNWRKNVVSDLSSASSSPQKYSYIRNLIFRYASLIAEDKEYNPAARYNAILLLGELNQSESQRTGTSVTPAVPYPRARQKLLAIAQSDDTDTMKLGALLGLARHARLTAAAGGRPDGDVVRLFVSVLQDKVNIDDEDAKLWMQRVAIDALGDVGHPSTIQFITPFLSDSSKPMMVRCAAADAIGRMDYRIQANIDEAAMLKGLGQVAADSLAKQIRGLQAYIKENPIEKAMEIRNRTPEDEATIDPKSKQVRRVLIHELQCVGRALRSLEQATSNADTKTATTSLRSEIGAVMKELNDETVLPHELFEKIGPPAVRVEAAVRDA